MSRTRKKGVWICVMLVAMLLALCGGEGTFRRPMRQKR